MPRLREDPTFVPVCPFCEGEIHEFVAVQIPAVLGVRYAYCCPQCRKVLGVSHRKGFWMG